MLEIKKQVQMLKALKSKKGTATTIEIAKILKVPILNVHDIGKHLINRNLVTKKVEKNHTRGGYNQSVWSLYPKSIEKIDRLIRESYGDD